MHTVMILISLGIALGIRFLSSKIILSEQKNWQKSLFFFLFPCLLLLMTAIAVVCMGYRGQMFGLQASWVSYFLAVIFVVVAIFKLIKLYYQAWLSQQHLRSYPQQIIANKKARILTIDFPYSAQIGLWNPQLVISQSLLNSLDQEHLQAVLEHEQAHYEQRDTFWFFWLGWIRSFTYWLPNSDILWQELLFLREMRADQKAAQKIDALLLAESLLIVAQNVNRSSFLKLAEICSAAFNDSLLQNRLSERINALLSEEKVELKPAWNSWLLLSLALIPLLTLPWHY